MHPSEERFYENVDKLSRIIPEIALRIQYLDPGDTSYTQTREGELNLCKVVDGKNCFFHSNDSAKKEAEQWFQSLNLSDHIEVLYIFGVGLGYYYAAVKPWLEEDPSHYVVFIEDDMSVLRRLLETENGTRILDDKQVQLHYFRDLTHGTPIFDWLTWYFIQMQPDVSALGYYEREREDFFTQVRSRLLHDTVIKESISAEYMRFGESFFRNFYSNILYLHESYHANKLFGRFKGIPAIICGAGPSLNKNFSVLETLSDRALIFSGGSSLNALSSRSFIPHFGAGIDPNPPQYERLMTNFGYEVPFFYRNRMYHRAFRAIHGPRLYLNGTGGYKVSEWFEQKLEIKDWIVDEGHNVINLSIDVARKLGCDPIILVGMDLAYTGMKSYASGVVANNEVKKESILNVKDLESGAFLRKDVNGEDVYTLWKWVSEAQWIGNYAKRHTDVKVLNATEGGIGFPDVENMKLADVAEKYLSRRYDLWTMVHGEIQNARFTEMTEGKILTAMKELYESLREAIQLCSDMITEIEVVEKMAMEGKKLSHNLQTGKAALYETELSANEGYQYILAILGMVHAKVLERRCHQIKYDWTLRSDTEKNLEILRINKEKSEFLRRAGEVNAALLAHAVHQYAAAGHDIGNFFEGLDSDAGKKDPLHEGARL